MNLIEANHQINVTSDNSVSSNSSFKSHLNCKSFNMFLTASGENWRKHHSMAIVMKKFLM